MKKILILVLVVVFQSAVLAQQSPADLVTENELSFGAVNIKLVNTSVPQTVPDQELSARSGGWQPQTLSVFHEYLGLISRNVSRMGCSNSRTSTLTLLNDFVQVYSGGTSGKVDITRLDQAAKECLMALKNN